MATTKPARRWLNRQPIWFALDALLVVVIGWPTVASMSGQYYEENFGPVRGLGWVIVLTPTVLLVVRRLAPMTVLLVSAAFYLVSGIDHGDDGNWILAVPFAAYAVTFAWGSSRSAQVLVPTAFAVALGSPYGPGGEDPSAVAVMMIVAMYGVGWVVGVSVVRSHERAAVLVADVQRAREEAESIASHAVADERARIAIELHDAVGHAVNVMVIQAGAARLASADDRSKAALREIERVGRSALTDLDRMLGLLHSQADAGTARAPVAPAHGIADIADLVAGVRAGGTDVVLDDRCAGRLDPVADRPASAAAYRIVQEALTNAIKHAGPAHVLVVLDCTPDMLSVSITDDGRGAAASPSAGGGRGLGGMRERVSVLGGTITAAPRPGGGYCVAARVPRSRPS